MEVYSPGSRRLALIRLATIFVLTVMAGAGATHPAATASKKPIAFSGRVESVDLKMGTVAVRHGVIPGFMPAMTMDYMVDNNAILKELTPADDIAATVYVGDPTLHGIHVVSHNTSRR